MDWDWDDGCCSELSVVVPDTLSGALGWPPSSGDGAILVESVKRREIISGRRRQVRPPPDRGRGSRNCAVPAVLLPGLFPFGNVCISLAPPSCYFAASSTADLALSLTLYQIYIISTHTLHTLACYQLLRAILLLLLGASAAAVRVFFLLFDFGGFFFLNYCATKLLLLVLLTSFALALSLLLYLSFFLSHSLSRSHCCTARLSWCLCVSPLTQKRVRVFVFVRFHSHKYTLSRKEQGFFLFLFFPLLHPLTAAAGHLDPSSSFASQPEHSGPAGGGMATRHRGPSLFHEAGGHLCRTITVKNPHATDPNSLLLSFLPCFFFARFSLTHTPTATLCAEEKK